MTMATELCLCLFLSHSHYIALWLCNEGGLKQSSLLTSLIFCSFSLSLSIAVSFLFKNGKSNSILQEGVS